VKIIKRIFALLIGLFVICTAISIFSPTEVRNEEI